MKKVALTGASGHLGSAILQELLHRDIPVTALVRRKGAVHDIGPSADFVTGDILDRDSLLPFLRGCDMLIHCAAHISIDGDHGGIVQRTNIDGTRNVFQIARQCGVRRVVHVSSIHAFQQQPMDAILDESRALADQKSFAYDRSKREGQEIALSMHGDAMEVLVVNPTSVIGPYDYKPSRAGRMLIGLLTGRQTFLVQGGFDFCDCRDVANAVVNGLTQGKAGECYLLSGKWHTLEELASMLSEVSGKNIRVRIFPPLLAKAGLPFARVQSWINGKEPIYTREALEAVFAGNRHISSAKAVRELNYHARPLRETLLDTAEWFQKTGYLV